MPKFYPKQPQKLLSMVSSFFFFTSAILIPLIPCFHPHFLACELLCEKYIIISPWFPHHHQGSPSAIRVWQHFWIASNVPVQFVQYCSYTTEKRIINKFRTYRKWTVLHFKILFFIPMYRVHKPWCPFLCAPWLLPSLIEFNILRHNIR